MTIRNQIYEPTPVAESLIFNEYKKGCPLYLSYLVSVLVFHGKERNEFFQQDGKWRWQGSLLRWCWSDLRRL